MADRGSSGRDPDDPVLLTVAAAARRLGVAPPTLRTWDRRYGLGPSAHLPGAHRRYTAEDLRRLDLMRRLTLDGVSAGDAARAARSAQVPAAGPAPVPEEAPPVPTPPTGPGRPAAPAAVTALFRAAVALDGHLITDMLSAELTRRGVVPTWTDVAVPLLIGIGRRWESTGRGVEVEHLVSDAAIAALHEYGRRGAVPSSGRHVLLACAEEEQHSLPLHAVAAALSERGVRAGLLGQRVPRESLAAAVRRSGPAAVFLWSQLPSTGDPGAIAAIPAVRPAPTVLVGGPGWYELPDHPRLRQVFDLAEAVAALSQAVR